MRVILQILVLIIPSFAYAFPGLDDVKSLVPLGGEEIDFSESKTELTELFFKSSDHFLESQELLFKAYGMDVEAKKVRAAIDYAKNSKNSEEDRINNSIKVTTEASDIIKDSMNLKSDAITVDGKIMYTKALIPAGKGIIATIKLVPVSKNMVASVTANPTSAFTQIGGLAKIIPNIPGYISTMVSTMKLIITGAKANNIDGAEDLESSLDDL